MNKILETILECADIGMVRSTHHTYKHGCAILYGNRWLAQGENKIKTHPKSPKPFKFICAEFDAVIDGARNNINSFNGLHLYVARYNKKGELANSKPCKWCEEMILKLGIGMVAYSVEGGYEIWWPRKGKLQR